MSRILWVTPKWPVPVIDGARRATAQVLSGLSTDDVDVDLLAIAPRDEDVDIEAARTMFGLDRALAVRRAPIGTRSQKWWARIKSVARRPGLPLTYVPFAADSVRRPVRRWVADGDYDAIVLDGTHTAFAFFDQGRFVADVPLIHRSHNVEWELWERTAESAAPGVRQALRWQRDLVKRWECQLVDDACWTVAISPANQVTYREEVPSARDRVGLLPVGFDLALECPTPSGVAGALPLLFVGRLDWEPNRRGLAWLLDHVWESAVTADPRLKLIVVGSGDGRWLESYRTLPNLDICGRVDDLDAVYRESAAVVSPVFYGSGVRIKALEAASHGRALIATALGVGGTGMEEHTHYRRAETVDDWVRVLGDLDRDALRAQARRAFDFCRVHYDAAALRTTFRAEALRRARQS